MNNYEFRCKECSGSKTITIVDIYDTREKVVGEVPCILCEGIGHFTWIEVIKGDNKELPVGYEFFSIKKLRTGVFEHISEGIFSNV